MRTMLVGCVCGVALAGTVACGNSNGANVPLTVAGCITQVDNDYMLVPAANGANGPVGTSGRDQKRYKLVDDANVGISRYVNREARITGRSGGTQADGTTTVHVTQMTGGGECDAGK